MSDRLGKTVRLMAIIRARFQNREPEDRAGLAWSQQEVPKSVWVQQEYIGVGGDSRAFEGPTRTEAGVLVCRGASTKVSGMLSPAG